MTKQFADDLKAAIPDESLLLDLEPEELGAKLLFLIRSLPNFHPDSISDDLFTAPHQRYSHSEPNQSPYPHARRTEIEQALGEAWAWLEAQGLIIPMPGTNGRNGHMLLSRRARKFTSEAEFTSFATARLIQREMLHPRLKERVWTAFMRGEFDVAVFQAMKAVEVAVRETANLAPDDIGTYLMRKAFHPKDGILTNHKALPAERQAISDIFSGAIGLFKNPHSHRDVPVDDPIQAAEIVMLANHLLKIVDSRVSK